MALQIVIPFIVSLCRAHNTEAWIAVRQGGFLGASAGPRGALALPKLDQATWCPGGKLGSGRLIMVRMIQETHCQPKEGGLFRIKHCDGADEAREVFVVVTLDDLLSNRSRLNNRRY